MSRFLRTLMRGLAAVLLCMCTATAWSEPYLAVFKGMQCASCHVHPGGGGMRNDYGNVYAQSELPAERLGDENAALWTGEVLEWLSVGGDLRAEYRYTDIPNSDSASEFDVVKGSLYLNAAIVPNRLSVYIDQQVAPGSSMNREAYVRLNSRSQKFFLTAGQFYLPYGLRLQDDTAFIRLATGVNFTVPDRGIQLGYDSGPWVTQVSLTNGSGGGSETDTGKQVSFLASLVRPGWRAGVSFNANNAAVGDRQMQNVFVGVLTGPVAWLAEVDLITDDLPGGAERDAIATLVEANWIVTTGHNIKLTYDYFDPDDDLDEDHQSRYSLVWEYTPIQFLQVRIGARTYDGVPQVDTQNRDVLFAELHGFF